MIIEVVDRYKYLGVIFSESGSFLNARNHIVQQAKYNDILIHQNKKN